MSLSRPPDIWMTDAGAGACDSGGMATPSFPAPPPAQVPMGDPTSVMGRRIGAYLIDVVLGWIVFFLLLLSAGDSADTQGFDVCGFEGSPTICLDLGDTTYFADDGDAGGIVLGMIGFWLFMGIVIQGATGGTPGKLMTGIRVVDRTTGQRAGFAKSGGRTFMWIVDAIPFIVPLVGLITGVTTKGHRRVGDMAAGTLVVGTRSVGQPPVVAGLTVPAGTHVPPPPSGGRYTPPPPGAQYPAPSPGFAPPAAPPVSPPVTDAFAPPGTPPGADAPVADALAAPSPPPAPQAPVPDPTPAQPATGDGIDAPKWDPDRRAYIQWDKVHQQWMQYDDASAQWRPL